MAKFTSDEFAWSCFHMLCLRLLMKILGVNDSSNIVLV